MIFEYRYYLNSTEAAHISRDTRAKYTIKYVNILIDFDVAGNEEQGFFLHIDKEEICDVVDTTNVIVGIHKEERIAIGDIIDYEELNKACWRYWQANQEDTL